LAVPAVANAVSEHANTEGFPPGYLQINPKTCKFLHKARRFHQSSNRLS
jgi:hypothetical protein